MSNTYTQDDIQAGADFLKQVLAFGVEAGFDGDLKSFASKMMDANRLTHKKVMSLSESDFKNVSDILASDVYAEINPK